MTRGKENKIKSLLAAAPRGVVLPLAWLAKKGISYKLAWWYCQSGWFEHLGHGAYHLKNDKPTLLGAIYSLQVLLRLPVHIGAKSALALLGRMHYVPMDSKARIFLFVEPNVRLPKWFVEHHEWKEKVILIKRRLLKEPEDKTLVKREVDGLPLTLSSPERAILETMFIIPADQTYQEAILLMENLNNLRSGVTQQLLESCTSIKAKRLFLHACEKHSHCWLNDLDITKINLGKGIRTIAEGGTYDAKYQLSVPVIKEQ